jgi:DNA-binding NtrC family response regulator
LNVFQITLPPLRQRDGDIPVLVEALIRDLNRKHGCKITEASKELLDQLAQHNWPGNVRELRNVIERALIIAGEGALSPSHLPHFHATAGPRPASDFKEPDAVRLPVGTTVSEAEKALIHITLQHTKNNKTRAAEILGISLKTLFNKLKEYGSQTNAEEATNAL